MCQYDFQTVGRGETYILRGMPVQAKTRCTDAHHQQEYVHLLFSASSTVLLARIDAMLVLAELLLLAVGRTKLFCELTTLDAV